MPRYLPDAVILGFSSLHVAPGCPELRADFVRLALGVFAGKRGYERFEAVVRSAEIETLKSILLAVTSAVENEDGFYDRALKVAAEVMRDAEFVRLAELAADVLDWGSPSDAECVARAWPALCDEVEFELEESGFDCDCPGCYDHFGEYTKNEARRVQLDDLRRFGRAARRK